MIKHNTGVAQKLFATIFREKVDFMIIILHMPPTASSSITQYSEIVTN